MNFNYKRLIWNLVAVCKWKFNTENNIDAKIVTELVSQLEVDLFDLHQELIGRGYLVHNWLSADLLLNNENYFRHMTAIQNNPHRYGRLQAYNYSEFFQNYLDILFYIEKVIDSGENLNISSYLKTELGLYIPTNFLREFKAYNYYRD